MLIKAHATVCDIRRNMCILPMAKPTVLPQAPVCRGVWRYTTVGEKLAQVMKTIPYGPYTAVIPPVSGDAYICGMNTFIIHPDDPLKDGFLLR